MITLVCDTQDEVPRAIEAAENSGLKEYRIAVRGPRGYEQTVGGRTRSTVAYHETHGRGGGGGTRTTTVKPVSEDEDHDGEARQRGRGPLVTGSGPGDRSDVAGATPSQPGVVAPVLNPGCPDQDQPRNRNTEVPVSDSDQRRERAREFFQELTACAKPDCLRKVPASSRYCCGQCGTAGEGGYEIHADGLLGHAASCNAKAAERGEWTIFEAEALR